MGLRLARLSLRPTFRIYGLIDEYQFGVVPVILGKGRKLLDDLDGPRQLSLAGEPEDFFPEPCYCDTAPNALRISAVAT